MQRETVTLCVVYLSVLVVCERVRRAAAHHGAAAGAREGEAQRRADAATAAGGHRRSQEDQRVRTIDWNAFASFQAAMCLL